MRRFCNRFLWKFGDLYTLLDVYNIFKNLKLAHAHYEANTMKPSSHSRPKLPLVAPTKSSHFSSRAKAVHSATSILPTKLVNATFFPRIFFMISVGKRDIKKLFVFPSSPNGSNFDYHNKIYQHLLLPLNHKPRHLSLPLRLSPPRVILVRMLRRRGTMLTRGRCFKPMPLKFKFCKMNSNH